MAFQRIFWCLRGMQSIFCTVSGQYSATPDSFFGLMLNKKPVWDLFFILFYALLVFQDQLCKHIAMLLQNDDFVSTVIIWKNMRNRLNGRERTKDWMGELKYKRNIYCSAKGLMCCRCLASSIYSLFICSFSIFQPQWQVAWNEVVSPLSLCLAFCLPFLAPLFPSFLLSFLTEHLELHKAIKNYVYWKEKYWGSAVPFWND